MFPLSWERDDDEGYSMAGAPVEYFSAAAPNPPPQAPKAEVPSNASHTATPKTVKANKSRLSSFLFNNERALLKGLVRLFQIFMLGYVAIPIAMQYKDGTICPYRIICATGPLEIFVLFLAKGCALLMYAPLSVIMISKCSSLISFLHETILVTIIDLHGLHEMHTDLGTEVMVYAILHVGGHVTRFTVRELPLFWNGGLTVYTGYIITILMLLIIPPMFFTFIKKRFSFETRKQVHMLALPFFLVLAYHQPRLLWYSRTVLIIYGLDKLYTNCVKAYRVDHPHLLPFGSGTLVGFKPPEGFRFKSGQYIFVCVPHISRGEWHPFSVIPATLNDGRLACEFYAQAAGDWTQKLLETAKRGVRRPLWISGSHPSPFDVSVSWGYIFLVCTGIGITPGISIISQYCGTKMIVLIWICRDEHLITLYNNELQVVNTKVFYTGNSPEAKPCVDGNVMYCKGRPNLLSEINNVILKNRPLFPDRRSTGLRMHPSISQNMLKPGTDANGSLSNSKHGGSSSTEGSKEDCERTTDHGSVASSENMAGILKDPELAWGGRSFKSSIPAGEAERKDKQPFRRAMMEYYHVEREDSVDKSEWIVLYCGQSSSLGDSVKQYCDTNKITFKTEFFGSW